MARAVDDGSWVLLAYRLPREPSAPRLAVWRKLKRLGAAQLVDGLVALPLDSRNREQLEWLADDVLEAGGQTWLWIARPGTTGQERALAAGLQAAIVEQYQLLIAEARAAAAAASPGGPRTLARLRRKLERIRRRDYFPPPEREEARRAVEAVAAALERRAA